MNTKKAKKLLVGAHMSIAGGLYKSIDRAQAVGGTCMQIFTKSNKQWASKRIDPESAQMFKERWKNSTISAVAVHASYLINIGSANHALRIKSIHALIDELQRCDLLGIPHLIVHPGAATNNSPVECINMIAQSINEIFEQFHGHAILVLENTAGQGSAVGTTLEQLAEIYKTIKHKKSIGFCIDTCHAFAAGYDISTQKGYELFWEQFDTLLGIEKLKAIHCNDSKKKVGSRVDRHEDIGKGELGIEPFRLLMNDERFYDIPKICETPKGDDEQAHDARNIEMLKNLVNH
ncbi:MAG: Endonuclease 4 [Candidatus Dependentiae bacterium ADurb.Bin331]|nr:MAG: Endonuclease 4 [Candidatus Dependentiae bacterium ADurb.Bin331]